METITITKRVINGKAFFNKRFDDYDKGFYGIRISKKEYTESKTNNRACYTYNEPSLNIVERITYNN